MSDNQLMDLYRKVSLFGFSDLRKLAPIGDIGYLNGIEFIAIGHLTVVLRSFCAPICLSGCTRLIASSSRSVAGRRMVLRLVVVFTTTIVPS